MIQQQSKLCLAAMKLVQWPALAHSVSRSLWLGHLKGQISILPYSFSSTMAQAQTPDHDKTLPNAKKDANSTEKVHAVPKGDLKNVGKDTAVPKSGRERTGKEVEAVMKVKSLTSALEICSTFNSQQRLHALKNLVAAKTRPLPLIQNLTEGISKSSEDLNVKDLSDLLFLLGKLSYINEDVMTRACESLRLQLKGTTNAAVVGSSIASLRKLQWKDPDLLDEFSIWIQNNITKFQNPSTFIYTLALQNHRPANLDNLLQLVLNDVKKNNYGSLNMVNLVWSINVLDCSFAKEETRETLNGFFNPRFLEKLGSGPFDIPAWIKLWNLHAIAKSSWGQAEDFKIPEAVKAKISSTLKRSDKANMVTEIAQLLFKDLDANLYSTGIPSQMGFTIDLVFSLDEKMNAVPLHLASSGYSRIAVMIHSFHECCQPTREPNGYRIFEMRLLGDEYKVVSVPYHLLGGGYAQVHEYFESVLSKVVRKQS